MTTLIPLKHRTIFAVFFNNQKGIFTDKAVRQALTIGTDKNAVLEAALRGNGTVMSFPSAGILRIQFPDNPVAYDKTSAESLLDAQLSSRH